MKYTPKIKFTVISYDKNTFVPTVIFFNLKEYNVDKENDKFVLINGAIFYKYKNKIDSIEIDLDVNGIKYINDYFYTNKELRKNKLKKLQEKEK